MFCSLDYVIPKGCKIFASFRAVHLNLEHYENARTFDPWRWQVGLQNIAMLFYISFLLCTNVLALDHSIPSSI